MGDVGAKKKSTHRNPKNRGMQEEGDGGFRTKGLEKRANFYRMLLQWGRKERGSTNAKAESRGRGERTRLVRRKVQIYVPTN